MKILNVVAELSPFSNVGGLSRGTKALSESLAKRGHELKIFTPLHSCVADYIKKNNVNLKKTSNSGREQKHYSSKLFRVEGENGLQIYLVSNHDFFELRSNIYGYKDDYKRYYFFATACLEWLLQQDKMANGWRPDVIQCHDWHTGYFIDLLKNNSIYKSICNVPVLFTAHNFKYQNEKKFQYLKENELDLGREELGDINSEVLKKQNSFIRGMLFAEHTNTVSPSHSEEIATKEYSYNLYEITKRMRHKTSGILNGLDYKDFNPTTDIKIKYNFDEGNFAEQKEKNKNYLREIFNLPKYEDNSPMFCYVGRMTSQKGLEYIFEAMGNLLKENPKVQLIGLGDGEDHYCELFWNFSKKFPNQIGLKLEHDVHLPRQVFAGSDFCLMPSNFEPGGIAALEAMRYGCVPIVRETGGLKDYINNFSKTRLQGNGFLFKEKSGLKMYQLINEVLKIYGSSNQKLWHQVSLNCLRYRRDWDDAAKEYEQLFLSLLDKQKNL
jgi:starch synthase